MLILLKQTNKVESLNETVINQNNEVENLKYQINLFIKNNNSKQGDFNVFML